MKELGCNKVAYAHHKDDVVETMLMSLIYEGRIHTFSPVTYLERVELTLIRPMIYMEEADIKGFINKYNIPVMKSPVHGWQYQTGIYQKFTETTEQRNPRHKEADIYSSKKQQCERLADKQWQSLNQIIITMSKTNRIFLKCVLF